MTSLHFTVDARDGRHHRFALTLALDVAPHLGDLELFLPAWTPGSYLIREHARHIGELRAVDADSGAAVTWQKTAKNRFRFRLPSTTRRLRVDYTVFAHELTVRTADLTQEHAFWNGVCLFLWPSGEREATATIDVVLPDGWALWTSLPARAENGRTRLVAHGIDQVADCPGLATGSARVLDFEVMGKSHRFVFDGLGAVEPPHDLVPHTRAVIEEAARVFAVEELPYPRYDFLTLVADRGQGGLEHRDGSVLLASRTALTTGKGYRDFLGLVAHEHFHAFNVKRMRPSDLWQVDYEGENHTTLLWVAEGFTAYYDDLLCRRGGAFSTERYLQIVADSIAEAHKTPGRLVHPLAQASYDAWIKFYRPDEDSKNSSQSYYGSGGLAAMCLDLEIRRRTHGAKSLDDVMASLWRHTYLADRGFTHDDVIGALSAAAGADLRALVTSLIEQPFDPDFDAALRAFGLRLRAASLAADAAGHVGLQLQAGTTVIAAVQRGGPAALAGIAAGDEVLAFAGLRVSSASFDEVLHAVAQPPRAIDVLLARRGAIVTRALVPEAPGRRVNYKIDIAEDATPEQTKLRRGWLRDA